MTPVSVLTPGVQTIDLVELQHDAEIAGPGTTIAIEPRVMLALIEALWQARTALLEYSRDPAAQTMRDGRWLSSFGPYRANHALNRIDAAGVVFRVRPDHLEESRHE